MLNLMSSINTFHEGFSSKIIPLSNVYQYLQVHITAEEEWVSKQFVTVETDLHSKHLLEYTYTLEIVAPNSLLIILSKCHWHHLYV